MKEFIKTEVKAETAVLVGLITRTQDERKTAEYLDELEFLAETAGAVTVKRFTQRLDSPSSVTYVGKVNSKKLSATSRLKKRLNAKSVWLFSMTNSLPNSCATSKKN